MRLYAEPCYLSNFNFHAFFTYEDFAWMEDVPWIDRPLYHIDEIIPQIEENINSCGLINLSGKDFEHAMYIYPTEYTKSRNIPSGLYINRSDMIKLLTFYNALEHPYQHSYHVVTKAETLKKIFIVNNFITEDRIKEIFRLRHKWAQNTFEPIESEREDKEESNDPDKISVDLFEEKCRLESGLEVSPEMKKLMKVYVKAFSNKLKDDEHNGQDK